MPQCNIKNVRRILQNPIQHFAESSTHSCQRSRLHHIGCVPDDEASKQHGMDIELDTRREAARNRTTAELRCHVKWTCSVGTNGRPTDLLAAISRWHSRNVA